MGMSTNPDNRSSHEQGLSVDEQSDLRAKIKLRYYDQVTLGLIALEVADAAAAIKFALDSRPEVADELKSIRNKEADARIHAEN